jgi:hypothetical protein
MMGGQNDGGEMMGGEMMGGEMMGGEMMGGEMMGGEMMGGEMMGGEMICIQVGARFGRAAESRSKGGDSRELVAVRKHRNGPPQHGLF